MRRRKRSGASLAGAALLLLACMLPAAGAKKKAVPEGYALVSGTVFQESGYALANAEVTLIPDPQPDSAALKLKKIQAVSDTRGEFVFRVPPASMHYIVRVAAKGFQSAEKPIAIQGEEHVEVTFQLPPESK